MLREVPLCPGCGGSLGFPGFSSRPERGGDWVSGWVAPLGAVGTSRWAAGSDALLLRQAL